MTIAAARSHILSAPAMLGRENGCLSPGGKLTIGQLKAEGGAAGIALDQNKVTVVAVRELTRDEQAETRPPRPADAGEGLKKALARSRRQAWPGIRHVDAHALAPPRCSDPDFAASDGLDCLARVAHEIEQSAKELVGVRS